MKVGLFSFHLEYAISGETQSIRNLSALLQKQGLAITLGDSLQKTGSEIDSHKERLFFKIKNLLNIPQRVAQNAKNLDLIQLHLPSPAFSFLAERLVKLVNIPVVVFFDGVLLDQSSLSLIKHCFKDPAFFGPRMLINNRYFARKKSSRANTVKAYIVAAETQKSELISLGYAEREVHVISNLCRPMTYLDPKEFYHAHAIPDNAKLIGNLGHFFYVKGVDQLVSALKYLPDDYYLCLAHSGLGSREQLEASIPGELKRRVRILGEVNVSAFMSALSVLVMPYRASFGTVMFPNTILEAISLGLPVIASDFPCYRELLGGGERGILWERGGVYSLAREIVELCENQSRLTSMKHSQREYYEKRLSPKAIGEAYLKLYQSLVICR